MSLLVVERHGDETQSVFDFTEGLEEDLSAKQSEKGRFVIQWVLPESRIITRFEGTLSKSSPNTVQKMIFQVDGQSLEGERQMLHCVKWSN